MTTVYLVRHSEPFKAHIGIEEVNESILFSNISTVSGRYGAASLSPNHNSKFTFNSSYTCLISSFDISIIFCHNS